MWHCFSNFNIHEISWGYFSNSGSYKVDLESLAFLRNSEVMHVLWLLLYGSFLGSNIIKHLDMTMIREIIRPGTIGGCEAQCVPPNNRGCQGPQL